MNVVLLPAPVPTKAVRRLAASVLIAEAFVVFFAVLVAVRLTPDRTRAVVITGIALAAAAIALAGLLRHRWTYLAGWLLQGALIATGFAVPLMFALGPIFAVLWGAAIRVGSRLVDR